MLKSEKLAKFDCVCIVGDFNFPRIRWNGIWTNEKDNEFIECLHDAYLEQMVDKPTRRRTGQMANILDLVLVNDQQSVSSIEHCCPVGKSDHEVLLFSLYIPKKTVVQEGTRFNLKKGNFDQMRLEFSQMDWSHLHKLNVEECWEEIKQIIHLNMEKNVPKVKIKTTGTEKPLWMSKKALRWIKKKYKCYQRFLKSKKGALYQKYIEIRNKCTKVLKKAKKEYEKNLAKNCKTNPKQFWKYVQSKTKSNVGISHEQVITALGIHAAIQLPVTTPETSFYSACADGIPGVFLLWLFSVPI